MHIPFTKPYWGKEEEQAAVTAIRTTPGSGDGAHTKVLAELLSGLTGAAFVYPVTSCTHGLELAMLALDIGVGDEIIMPSFTMSSTANAVVLRGATPVFAEIEDTNFCIDPTDIERKITVKTRGIIVVHYAGMPCAMEKIQKIAKKHKLFIVEDAAHAIATTYHGRMLGNWGDIGVYSFHGTKNVTCGEGGAVMTNDETLAKKMEILRANGTNRSAFLRGEVDKYSWVSVGSSYFLSDILAAIAAEQVKKITVINSMRTEIAEYFTESLQKFSNLVRLPNIPDGCVPNWHIYGILFPGIPMADTFFEQMRSAGIDVSRHYVPLHSAPAGRRVSSKGRANPLPVTDRVARTLMRLPIYPGLTKVQQTYIVASARRILEKLR